MTPSAKSIVAFATAVVLGLTAGCVTVPLEGGKFEKTLEVSGPIRLELNNGSGSVTLTRGEAGRVQIRAEFTVRAFFWEASEYRAQRLTESPPIEQTGNVIRIGYPTRRVERVRVDYTIEVPVETELQARIGSGRLEAQGIRGPARLASGSADLSIEDVGAGVEASSGSGEIRLSEVDGQVEVSTGSGNVRLESITGNIQVSTGSGDVYINRPGGRVRVETGSGDMRFSEISHDLRIVTGSGDATIGGNPDPRSYWELRASSGDISLNLTAGASFRLYARTSSGDVDISLPMTIEEKSRRELRGRVGRGEARVEIRTSSGDIRIR